ncbi:unnamed protein product [Schistocephalus solidus]|uniref:Cation channel sperm-associated protein subunit beta n=1 Tax=Schistocephalus solidus TaxID=70667 RepID=A0A183SZB6_SCHSO|nr:unnamed protein product [Schistocephalus solidus]
MKTQVLKAFAGETKPLRCIQSRQHENIGWFLSETSPFSRETLTQGLVQVPEESTCYRIYQTTQNVTVNILEVLVQKETIGFFTCAEETSLYTHTNRRVWSVLDVYLITMFEPAVDIINVTLHSLAETCKQAMALLNEENSISKVPYLELRHPLISYSWGRIICEARSVNNYQCYQPTGRDGQSVPNDQALWKGTQKAGYLKLQKDKYLLIPGSISGGYMRIRLNGVSIYSTGSVWFELVTHRTSPGTVSAILKDPEHNQYIVFETKTLSSLATVILSKDKVCAEAWQTASSSDYFVTFDYIILEPLLSYMEFPGGIRIPFKHALDPVDFSEIRGLRIWASPKTVLSIIHKEQTIDSIYYETPTRPEHLLERMIPRGPLPEPTVSHSECDQNYAKTRHIASYCHNLPPTCFEDGKKERMYTITLLRDISDLPISIEPASSLVTVESLLRVSEFEGPFYEILFVVKQVGGTSTNYIPILRILWDRKRMISAFWKANVCPEFAQCSTVNVCQCTPDFWLFCYQILFWFGQPAALDEVTRVSVGHEKALEVAEFCPFVVRIAAMFFCPSVESSHTAAFVAQLDAHYECSLEVSPHLLALILKLASGEDHVERPSVSVLAFRQQSPIQVSVQTIEENASEHLSGDVL